MSAINLISSRDALNQYLGSLLYEDSSYTSGISSNLDVTVPKAKADHIPEWATATFDCLLFTVNGVRLAVPFDKTGGLVEWCRKVASHPSHSPWIMGSVIYLGQEVTVINTSILIPAHTQHLSIGHLTSPQHLILIGDGRYALAVEGLAEITSFDAEKIRWRRGRTERPWYCGIAVEQQCALVDIDALINIIEPASKLPILKSPGVQPPPLSKGVER